MKKWTKQEISKLKKLWQSGKTMKQIAEIFNISREAVAGAIYRSGLPKNPKTKVKKPPRKKQKSRYVYKKQPEGTVEFSSLNRNQCCYMGGDFEVKKCCGEPVYKKQMCQKHYDLCYIELPLTFSEFG